MILALKTSRVLLIVTSRRPHDNFELPHKTPLMHLPLDRLDPCQAGELLHNVSRLSMESRASAEIIARADGVPLFIEELGKAFIESDLAARDGGGVRQHDVAVPATLQELADGQARSNVAGQARCTAGGRARTRVYLSATFGCGSEELETNRRSA